MPSEEKPANRIKVTDKRLFTSDGDLREEFKESISPTDHDSHPQERSQPPTPEKKENAKKEPVERNQRDAVEQTASDPMTNPGTPFTLFLESLIVNAYMSLGMIRNPFRPDSPTDLKAAKQMIEIISMLQEKTSGNLSPEEGQFLENHLGELKLAFVRRSKAI